MRVLESIARRMALALQWAGGAMVIAMMVHVTADIVGRVLFDRPITGTLEIVSAYYMVGCCFLPLAYVQFERQQMVIELFTQNLSGKPLIALSLLSGLIGLVFLGLTSWQTFLVALKKTAVGEAMEATFFDIAVWPSRWVIVAAVSVTAFILALQVVQDARGLFSRGGKSVGGSAHLL